MWFNGTELSAQAQRALRERAGHHRGPRHRLHPHPSTPRPPSTPPPTTASSKRCDSSSPPEINSEILANFLRDHSRLQKCFQIRHEFHGKPRYIAAEKVYAYEHGSPFKVSDRTRDKLLEEIDEYEFFSEPIEGRIPLNKFDDFFQKKKISACDTEDLQRLQGELNCYRRDAKIIIDDLVDFTRLQPRYPDRDRQHTYVPSSAIELTPEMTREEVIAYLDGIRSAHPTAELAFHAYRDVRRSGWTPFLKAAVERNPVCIEGSKDLDEEALVAHLEGLPNESIYDGDRMAQPDEVWNFARGDGLERALCLATVWKARRPEDPVHLRTADGKAAVSSAGRTVAWATHKGLELEQTL